MSRKPPLHCVDELLSPGLERTLAAIDPPPEDAALVALLRMLAATLDRMSNAERRAMAGQTTPQYHRGLVELDKRRAARGPQKIPGQVSRLDRLRQASGSSRRPDFL